MINRFSEEVHIAASSPTPPDNTILRPSGPHRATSFIVTINRSGRERDGEISRKGLNRETICATGAKVPPGVTTRDRNTVQKSTFTSNFEKTEEWRKNEFANKTESGHSRTDSIPFLSNQRLDRAGHKTSKTVRNQTTKLDTESSKQDSESSKTEDKSSKRKTEYFESKNGSTSTLSSGKNIKSSKPGKEYVGTQKLSSTTDTTDFGKKSGSYNVRLNTEKMRSRPDPGNISLNTSVGHEETRRTGFNGELVENEENPTWRKAVDKFEKLGSTSEYEIGKSLTMGRKGKKVDVSSRTDKYNSSSEIRSLPRTEKSWNDNLAATYLSCKDVSCPQTYEELPPSHILVDKERKHRGSDLTRSNLETQEKQKEQKRSR